MTVEDELTGTLSAADTATEGTDVLDIPNQSASELTADITLFDASASIIKKERGEGVVS